MTGEVHLIPGRNLAHATFFKSIRLGPAVGRLEPQGTGVLRRPPMQVSHAVQYS